MSRYPHILHWKEGVVQSSLESKPGRKVGKTPRRKFVVFAAGPLTYQPISHQIICFSPLLPSLSSGENSPLSFGS